MNSCSRIALGAAMALSVVATAALADGAPKRAVPVGPAPFSWTGFYLGGNAGGAWSSLDQNVTFATGATEKFSFDPSSFAGGVQAGYQVQMGAIVLGVEVGLTGFDLRDRRVATVQANTVRQSDVDWLFTVTPRIAYAADKWMAYFKGGYANAEVARHTTLLDGSQRTGGQYREDGWTIGGGFEYAIASWVSLGVDYSYVNIDPRSSRVGVQPQFLAAGAPFGISRNSEVDLHLVTARINFKIGNH